MTTVNKNESITSTDTTIEENEHEPSSLEYKMLEEDTAVENKVDGINKNDSVFTKKQPVRKKPLQTFYTREIAKLFGRDEFLVISLQEFLIYFTFLIVLSFVTFGYSSPSSFRYTDNIDTLFTRSLYRQIMRTRTETTRDFRHMDSMEDVLSYLLHMLYIVSYTKNGTGVKKETSRAMEDNVIIGYMTLRQVRVRNDSCQVPDHFKLMFADCYGPYSELTEDKKTFGLQSGEVWIYRSANELAMNPYRGEVATYGGGGYYIHLVRHREVLIPDYHFMTTYKWIDRGTRALFIDLATYNVNVNHLGIIKLVVEFPHTGGVIQRSNIRVVRLINELSIINIVHLISEFVIVVFTMYFTSEELYEMYYFKLDYVKSFWNWLDLSIVIVLHIKNLFTMYLLYTTWFVLVPALLLEKHRMPFDTISSSCTIHCLSVTVAVFLAWLKAFKYLTVFNTMYKLQMTLGKAAGAILWFSGVFLTVFVSFAVLAHLLLGSEIAVKESGWWNNNRSVQLLSYADDNSIDLVAWSNAEVKGFRTVGHSFFTLLSAIIGNVNYREIENADYLLGSIYFSTFVFVVFFILMNIFVAIVIYTYKNVHNQVDPANVETSILDLVSIWWIELLFKMGYHDRVEKCQYNILVAKAKAHYQYICNFLRRFGYSKVQIGLFWEKYGVSDYKDIIAQDVHEIVADLRTLGVESANKMLVNNYHRLYFKMNQKVNNLEDAVEEAKHKVTVILDKIDVLHQIQVARRLSESRI